MPLQFRRGTRAEYDLLNVPLAEGEPLWITDTGQLFIGNGTTLANALDPVIGFGAEESQDATAALFAAGTHTDISFNYDDLDGNLSASVDISQFRQNVDLAGFGLVGTGSINIAGEIRGDFKGSVFADDSTLLIDGADGSLNFGIGDLLDVKTSDVLMGEDHSPNNGEPLVWNAMMGHWMPQDTLIADITGSVLGQDSTVLVDATDGAVNLDGTVHGNIIPNNSGQHAIGAPADRFKELYLSEELWLGMAQVTASGAGINLPAGSTIDGAPLEPTGGTGGNLNVNIIGDDSSLIVSAGTNTVNADLIIAGTILSEDISGNFVGSVFADDSSIIVDGMTGDVSAKTITANNLETTNITTTNVIATNIATTFATIQSITSAGSALDFSSDTGNSTFSVNSTDNAGILTLRKNSDADLSGTTPAYGRIVFARDDANGPSVNALISGTDLALTFAVDDTGTFADSSKFFVWTGSNFGIGTTTPTHTLDVNGSGKFAGDVEAAAFKGSVVSDDSTIMIDAVENTITVGSFIQFGSLTSIERDDLTAANGMVIYNTTNNKFEGYQNGAWINLDDGTAAS